MRHTLALDPAAVGKTIAVLPPKPMLAGAGLDVFEKEPHVLEAFWAMADLAAANLQAHFAGQPLFSAVPEWH